MEEKKMGLHSDRGQGGEHNICSSVLGADDEGLDRGGGEVGLEPKPATLWWRSTYADEMMEDIEIRTSTRQHKLPFEKNQDCGTDFQSSWTNKEYLSREV